MQNFPKELLSGYDDFRAGRLKSDQERYGDLAQNGQRPHTMVISCCDSRATPEAIFNSGPGEIFVVRNVANLVAPNEPENTLQATSSALEFAVQALGVKNILVMGHARCGGINAALKPLEQPLSSGDFIGKWTGQISPLAEEVRNAADIPEDEKQTALERRSVRQSIENLRGFSWIAEREEKGELELLGAWFDIANGELWLMDKDSGEFLRP